MESDASDRVASPMCRAPIHRRPAAHATDSNGSRRMAAYCGWIPTPGPDACSALRATIARVRRHRGAGLPARLRGSAHRPNLGGLRRLTGRHRILDRRRAMVHRRVTLVRRNPDRHPRSMVRHSGSGRSPRRSYRPPVAMARGDLFCDLVRLGLRACRPVGRVDLDERGKFDAYSRC